MTKFYTVLELIISIAKERWYLVSILYEGRRFCSGVIVVAEMICTVF